MKTDKQDLVYTRTASALEQKLGTKKKYSELLGELDDARKEVAELRSLLTDELKNVRSEISRTASSITQKVEDLDTNVKAELKLKVGVDDNDQIVSMINASAEVIELRSNRLIVESDNFSISEDGKIEAKSGKIGGITITPQMLTAESGKYGVHSFVDTFGNIQDQQVGYLFIEFSSLGVTASVKRENSPTSQQVAAGYVLTDLGWHVTTTLIG